MGEIRNAFRVLVIIPKGRDHLGDLGDGGIIFKWI
jgi:hypothetical protein